MNKRWIRATCTVALLSALAACSSSEPEAEAPEDAFEDGTVEEIVLASAAEMGDLDSVRIVGELTEDGNTVTVNLRLTADGECEGQIDPGFGTIDLIVVGGNTYLKAPADVFELLTGADGDLLELVGDRWLLMPGDTGLGEICDVAQFTEGFNEDAIGDNAEVGGVSDINGIDVVAITDASLERPGTTAYIAVDEDHYLVRMEAEGAVLDFVDFNDVGEIVAPEESEVFDLTEVG